MQWYDPLNKFMLLKVSRVVVIWSLVQAIFKARFPLPELTARVDEWPVSTSSVDGPSTRVVETGLNCFHNAGSGDGAGGNISSTSSSNSGHNGHTYNHLLAMFHIYIG